jgi:hypothetical protein
MERSRKICRQLRKAFDTEDTGLLLRMANCPVTGVLLSGLEHFLDQVDAAYAQGAERLKLAARSLQISSDELTEANRELEALNAAMHTMLGELGQGLLMFGRDGLCFDTYFSACLTLFGEPPAGRPIAEVLGIEASARSRFQTAIDLAYSDDCTMPFDEIIAMAMAPRRIEQAGKRNIDVSYRPIRDFDDRLVSILVILTGHTTKISTTKIKCDTPPYGATGARQPGSPPA